MKSPLILSGVALAVLFISCIVAVSYMEEPQKAKKSNDIRPLPGSPGEFGAELEIGSEEKLSASHILLMHTGSERAPASIKRSKKEALALAQKVAQLAQKTPSDFAKLAKEYSDGPSGVQGGDLGEFPSTKMVAPFSNATKALEVGQVSDPVETQFGYHIIIRQPLK